MQSKLILSLACLVAADVRPAGDEQLRLPQNLHIKNMGGSDGAGLCVFASITHSAYWQRQTELEDFFQWMRKYPGGGYPSKVDKMVQEKTGGRVKVIQYEGNDLDVLRLAVATGRMPAVTYAISPTGRYNGKRIAHMVSLVGIRQLDGKEIWEILDNNYPGTIERMSEAEFRRAFSLLDGRGWAVILYPPGPPPLPQN